MRPILRAAIFLILISMTTLAHAETKAYFSPNGGCQDAVVAEIKKAHRSIDIAMFTLTSKDIAQALVEAKKHQVKIQITLDKAQIKDHYSKSRYLINKGINVKFHMGPGLMHDKFAIIDDAVVLTGSFNWTLTAEKKNSENLLIVTDKDLAVEYEKQFKHLWSQSGEGSPKENQSAE